MLMTILNFIVLTLTLAAVVWYTIETRRMQIAVSQQVHELVHQTRLTVLPAFVAAVRHIDSSDYLELTNIGNGIAINISIGRVEIRFPTLEPGHVIFDELLMLRPGEKCNLKSRTFIIGSVEGGDKNDLTFLGRHGHFNTDVPIRFQDIEGNKYIQILKMGKDGYVHGFVKPDEVEKAH
jgi:hypothetical protein